MLGAMLAIVDWLRYVIAFALFVGILWVGFSFLRGLARVRPKERVDPEEVSDLDVYFVCKECGTLRPRRAVALDGRADAGPDGRYAAAEELAVHPLAERALARRA